GSARHPGRHSFPTRRSSDLRAVAQHSSDGARQQPLELGVVEGSEGADRLDAGGAEPGLGLRPDPRKLADVEPRQEASFRPGGHEDRKSTRLNSSHEWISYAV